MTFAQAQEYLDKYFNKWHEKIGLTLEQWNILKDSINNTVFGEGPMLQFFNKVDELEAKGSVDYWNNEEGTGKLDKLSKELEEAYNNYNKVVAGINKADHDRIGVASGPDFEKFKEEVENGYKTNYGSGWKDIFRFKEGDLAGDTLDGISKAYQEALKEKEEFYQKFAEENNLDNRFEAEKYINALIAVKNAMADANSGTVEYLNSLELDSNAKNILVLHTDYPGAKDTDGRLVDSVENLNLNILNKFDLVLCGHIHKPQRLSKKVYMVGAPLQQRRTDSKCELGYWLLYKDLSMEFKTLKSYPKFIDVEDAEDIKDDGNYYTVVPKTSRVKVNLNHKITKQLSKKSLAKKYMREKGIKDNKKRDLLINVLNKAEKLC